MILTPYSKILDYAVKLKIMVGAFNSFNLESLQAVVTAADKIQTPLIVQTYHSHVDYAGANYMVALAEVAATKTNEMIAMGLDHGRSFEQAKMCIDAGYSGVMIDLSSEDLKRNIEETKKVVELAHSKGVSVEAELGTIITADHTVQEIASGYTDPNIARKFVEETGVDCLAVSVGTAHGLYKYKPMINFDLVEELVKSVGCPIVVHGGSGVPDDDVLKLVKLGVAKFNIGTDFFVAYNSAIYQVITENGPKCDVIDIMAAAREAVERVAIHKLEILTAYRI